MGVFSVGADMDSLRRYFTRKEQARVKEYSLVDYDETYEVAKTMLKLGGLRLMRDDSASARRFWEWYYWFSFGNLLVASGLELVCMAQTAEGGTFQDAVNIFRMMPCLGLTLLAMAKSYPIVYHRPVFEKLHNNLRDMWPQGPVAEEEHSVISGAMGHLHFIIQGYYWCNKALIVIFLIPTFTEFTKRALGYDAPLILPFFYWLPYDPFQRVYYEVTLVTQIWHGLITVWFMISYDLLFCIYLFHITTQFNLLSVRIRRLVYVPTDRQLLDTYPLAKYSEGIMNEGTGIHQNETERQMELSKIILRHQDLISLSRDVEDMFSFALLVNFFNSSIIICFCGFCAVVVEKWNEMAYKSFLVTALSQTWIICWYGQKLRESSAGVADALYDSGWYRAFRKIRSAVLIMLHRSNKHVFVTTYGFSNVSLVSYTMIIKTAWSYFTLLLNIYSK